MAEENTAGFDLDKVFDFGTKGRDAFIQQYQKGQGFTSDQINTAFRTKYGIDAPTKVLSQTLGHDKGSSAQGLAGFFDRVQRGDFLNDVSSSDYRGTSMPYLRSSEQELARQANLNAVRPAADSLSAQLPEISERFAGERSALEAEKDPLKARYDNLISQITGRQTSAVNRQTTATSNELGRRGISGGLAEQSIADAVNPLETEFGSILKDTGFERESGLRGLQNAISQLAFGETDAKRVVNNAIAQLIANAGLSGVQQGTQNFQFDQGQRSAQQQFDFQQKQAETANQLAQRAVDIDERRYNETTLPESQIARQHTQATIDKLLSNLGGGGATTTGFSTGTGYNPTSSAPPALQGLGSYSSWSPIGSQTTSAPANVTSKYTGNISGDLTRLGFNPINNSGGSRYY